MENIYQHLLSTDDNNDCTGYDDCWCTQHMDGVIGEVAQMLYQAMEANNMGPREISAQVRVIMGRHGFNM